MANAVPSVLARVVPAEIPLASLGKAGASDVFVTAADDIAGMGARQLARRLGIQESVTGFNVIEFPTSAISGIASPINRKLPGFVGRGLTSGGAREFVIPNGSIPFTSWIRTVR